MCTLIALHRCVPGAPLVIAANRDEFLDRPAEGPALRQTPNGVILAPLDIEAGGTWLAVNSAGLFAAVTNRRCDQPDPGRRSRGWLVIDALAATSAEEAIEELEHLPPGAYNPFNLFVGDGKRAFALTYHEGSRRIDLDAGPHVIGNVDLLAPHTPKLRRLREKVERAAAAPLEHVLDRLAEICRAHEGDGAPLEDACVHAGPYGTCSSALLRLGENDSGSVLRFADGAPCRTEYEDFTPLLHRLGRASRVVEGESATRKAS